MNSVYCHQTGVETFGKSQQQEKQKTLVSVKWSEIVVISGSWFDTHKKFLQDKAKNIDVNSSEPKLSNPNSSFFFF